MNVVESQILESPQTEHVSCYAAQDVWHVARLEEFDGVGYADVVAFDAEDSGGKLLHIRFDCGKLCPCSHRTFGGNAPSCFSQTDAEWFNVEVTE